MNRGRLQTLEAMRQTNPRDTRVLFALANEYEKGADWERVVTLLTEYLRLAEDEGNAWGRLGFALRRLDRLDQARDAYARGIEAANRHGHPAMAAELEQALADLAG